MMEIIGFGDKAVLSGSGGERIPSPLEDAVCYLIVPSGPQGRGPTRLSGLAWELLVRLRQLGDQICGMTHLFGVDPGCASLWSFDQGRFLPAAALAANRPFAFLANAAFFLEEEPPVAAILAEAHRHGLAAYADESSGVLYAMAAHRDKLGCEGFARMLTQLVCSDDSAAKPRWDGQAAVLSAHEVGPVSRPGSPLRYRRPPAMSAVYLNAALAEAIYAAVDTGPVNHAPECLRQGLLAQRERSSVPWIFNTLANEVELRMGLTVMDSFPPEMHVSITGHCNIECRFCNYTHGYGTRHHVDVEQIARLGYFRHMHTLRVSSGIGEPTINPHLPAILDYVARQHPQIAINFFTNGTVLGRRGLIDALVGQATWINVSLNAATAGTWQELCLKDLFGKLTGGLVALEQAKRNRNALLPIVYGSMVLTAKNLHELPQMPALCRELGVDRFTAIPFFSYNYQYVGKYGGAESLHRCRDEYDAVYDETLSEAKKHGVSIELPRIGKEKRAVYGVEDRAFYDFAGVDGVHRPLCRLVDHLDYAAGPHCPELWRIAHISSTATGHANQASTHFLYPCLGPLVTVDFSDRMPFNFPDSEGWLDLWNNPVLVRLRAAQRHSGISKVCDLCRNLDSRDPACFADLDELLREWRG